MTTTVPTFDLQRLGPWGRTLTLDPPSEGQRALPTAALYTGATLHGVLHSYGEQVGTDRLSVAASAWSKDHAKALLPGPLAAWILDEIGLDVAPHNTHLHLDGATPVALRVLDPERMTAGPLGRDLLLDSLFARHLTPLYERIHEVSGLGMHVLWNNAGNLIAWILDRAGESLPDNPRIPALRNVLLESPVTPWDGKPNPLKDPVDYETLALAKGPTRIQVRRVCCLRHALPEKSACTTCPLLKTDERLELVRSLENHS